MIIDRHTVGRMINAPAPEIHHVEDPGVLAYVFQTFLSRQNIPFRRVNSKTSPSIYFKLHYGPGEIVVRVSNHEESGYKPAKEMADFNILNSKQMVEVQKIVDKAHRTLGPEVFRYKVSLVKKEFGRK